MNLNLRFSKSTHGIKWWRVWSAGRRTSSLWSWTGNKCSLIKKIFFGFAKSCCHRLHRKALMKYALFCFVRHEPRQSFVSWDTNQGGERPKIKYTKKEQVWNLLLENLFWLMITLHHRSPLLLWLSLVFRILLCYLR